MESQTGNDHQNNSQSRKIDTESLERKNLIAIRKKNSDQNNAQSRKIDIKSLEGTNIIVFVKKFSIKILTPTATQSPQMIIV